MLHVTGDNFWAYAVAERHATLTPAAAESGDEACRDQRNTAALDIARALTR